MRVAPAGLAGCLAALVATAAAAAEVGIAFVGALSGPQAWAGRDQRDGFVLALEQRKGRLGGIEVRFSELDERDGQEPEGVRVETGLPTEKNMVFVSSGAGPPELAGERCSARFFSVAPPRDAVHENAGAIAQARRYRKVQLFAAPAQRAEVEAAFRRAYEGEVVWGSELREVREARPHAVYLALPPQEMLAFLRGYEDVGLFHRIPVIAAGVEPRELEALGPAFSGLDRLGALGARHGARSLHALRRGLQGQVRQNSFHLRDAGLRRRPASRRRAQALAG